MTSISCTCYSIHSLGYDLLDLCLNGPLEQLDRTEYCQPAVVVTSLAAAERLRHQNEDALSACIGAAGLSVGEISALIFAGAISFEDGIRLVKVRLTCVLQILIS